MYPMQGPTLSARIKQAPTTPGVYLWHARNGTPLYIGKAANLRARLKSYPNTTHPRIRVMVQAAVTLTWQQTDTDIEALILESQLIKQYNPKFNIGGLLVMSVGALYFTWSAIKERRAEREKSPD